MPHLLLISSKTTLRRLLWGGSTMVNQSGHDRGREERAHRLYSAALGSSAAGSAALSSSAAGAAASAGAFDAAGAASASEEVQRVYSTSAHKSRQERAVWYIPGCHAAAA